MAPESPTTKAPEKPRPTVRKTAPALPLGLGKLWSSSAARFETRERLISSLQTLAWVVPLTILVWIYAERMQTQSAKIVIDVKVQASDRDRVASIIRPQDPRLTAEITGPLARISDLRNELGSIGVLTLTLENLSSTGQRDVSTMELLSKNPIFTRRGITVKECTPAALTVYVDQWVSHKLRVQAPVGIDILDGEPLFDPPVVTVEAPASAISTDVIMANLQRAITTSNIANKPPDRYTIDVDLIPPTSDDRIQIQPKTVRATVNIKRADRTFTIAAMPIWPFTPPGLQDRYQIEHPPTVSNVAVVGPDDKIRMLEAGDFQPRAILEITSSDIPTGEERLVETRKPLQYVLPPGVSPAPEEIQQNIVSIRLVKRATAE